MEQDFWVSPELQEFEYNGNRGKNNNLFVFKSISMILITYV